MEILYVLQAVAKTPTLSTAQLASYLQTMLRSSRRSRRHGGLLRHALSVLPCMLTNVHGHVCMRQYVRTCVH